MDLLNHRFFWFLIVVVMSAYILYEHSTSSLAVDSTTMMERHEKFLAGESEFFNPWQYRILAPFLLEGIRQVFDVIAPGSNPLLPYLALKFFQTCVVLLLALVYYRALRISNPLILFMGLMLLSYNISNSVFQSDFSFNTYFDIIFYLAGAWVILRNDYWWIIPISGLAAMNRETGGFIPVMLICAAFMDENREGYRNKLIAGGLAMLLFGVVFITIRLIYGYQEAFGIHGLSGPLDYLKFNLTFFRMYPQLLGTLGLIPLIFIIGLRRIPQPLRVWFWLIVPFWFLIHLVKSTAVESRLFLVPQALIFIPGMLYLAEHYLGNRETTPGVGIRHDRLKA